MSRLALALLLATAVAAAAPTAKQPIDDAAFALTDEQHVQLAELLAEPSELDIAVVLVRTTGDVSIERYAHEAAVAWHAGSKPSALLVLALDDRRSRLELDAAARAHISDATSRAILDDVRPRLQAKAYAHAVELVVRAVRREYAKPPAATAAAPPANEPSSSNALLYVLIVFGALAVGGCAWAAWSRRATATVSSDGAHPPAFAVAALLRTLQLALLPIVGLYLLWVIVRPGSSPASSYGAGDSGSWSPSDDAAGTYDGGSSSTSSSETGSGGATSSW